MTRSTMSFALMDPAARALDDLMNQGFDLDEILRVTGGVTSAEGHTSAADSPQSAPLNKEESAIPTSVNSEELQGLSIIASEESSRPFPLPSCHHCGIAPETSHQILSEMLRCEHHLCGVVFHSECLRVAQSKASRGESGSVMFCPACAHRLVENTRLLSLHSIEVVSRPPICIGSSSNGGHEGGIFSKYTVGAATSSGSGAANGLGNGLFIAGAAHSSGETKDDWSSKVAAVLKVSPQAVAFPSESASSSSSSAPSNTAGRVATNSRRKWRGTDESSSSFL